MATDKDHPVNQTPQSSREGPREAADNDDAHALPSSRPTRLIDPVLAVRELSRYDFPGRRFLGRADCALVIAGPGAFYETFLPPRRPTTLRGRTAAYEVDLGVHPLRLRTRLPSDVDSFEFDTTFDLTWQVTDPERFVISQERDIPALLNRLLHRLLRPVTRKFPISSSARAEESVQQVLDASGDHAARQGLRLGGTARLRRDPGERAAQYDVAAVLSEHEVELLRLEHQQDLKARKIAFYRHHLAKGGLDALLLHLAEHTQDTGLVVENLRADEARMIENQLGLIDRVLPEETLEKYQLEEPQQLVLALFRAMFTQSMNASTDAQPEDPLRKPPDPAAQHFEGRAESV
ncbi:hypothetical protein [Streptomyces sp. Je 1-332]|uniref:hypothetical protein n=1 Tax=Streptomyces sp. Je 1-332 TaxID=3231270 RepID=UPI003457B8E4